MKNLSIILLILIPLFSFGQTEKETSKKISAEFEEFYNLDKFQNIFELFSSEMKSTLPIEKTNDFLKGLKNQAGKIKKREFKKIRKRNLRIV